MATAPPPQRQSILDSRSTTGLTLLDLLEMTPDEIEAHLRSLAPQPEPAMLRPAAPEAQPSGLIGAQLRPAQPSPYAPTLEQWEIEAMTPQQKFERAGEQGLMAAEAALMLGAPHVPGLSRLDLEQTVAGETPVLRRRTIPAPGGPPLAPRAGRQPRRSVVDPAAAEAALVGENLGETLGKRKGKSTPEELALNRYMGAYGLEGAVLRTKGGKPVDPAQAPTQEAVRLEREGKPVYIGRLTPEQWMDKQVAWVGPKDSPEWNAARNWYRDLLAEFTKVYGAESAPEMLNIWGLSQQRASPSAGMMHVLRAQDIVAGWRTEMEGKAGLAHDRLLAALRKQDPTVGEKLADFADAIAGKTTRRWVGDDPRGGQPAPFDVHASRDAGYVDEVTLAFLQKNYGPEVAAQFKQDMKGAPSPAQYAYGSRFYNQLKDTLNANLKPGERPYTAAEVQAIGWVGQQRMMGESPEGPAQIFRGEAGGRTYANISRVAIEAAPGEGAPRRVLWEQIPEPRRAEATYQALQSVAGDVAKFSGVALAAQDATLGIWEQYKNPNVVFEVVGTPEGALRFAKAMGYVGQQTENWAQRSATRGRANAFGLDIVAPEGYDLSRADDVARFWRESGLEAVPGLGATPIRGQDGRHRLRLVFERDLANLSKAAVEDGRDFDVLAERALKAIESSPVSGIRYEQRPLTLQKAVHDWKGDQNGEGHLIGLGGRARGELDGLSRRVEESLRSFVGEAAGARGTGAATPARAEAQAVGPTLRSLLVPTEGEAVGAPIYSQARKIVEDPKTQATQTGEAWLRFLSDPKRGVKAEEFQYTGLGDMLKGKAGQRVTREEILGHLDANQIEVKDVVKGAKPYDRDAEALKEYGKPYAELDQQQKDWISSVFGQSELPPNVKTKFSKYTLPGAENYREVLLTLPDRSEAQVLREEAQRRGYGDQISQWPDQQFAARYRQVVTNAPRREGVFTSGHWDEPNVLAHLRLSDRKDADGKRVLLVEELQSDWAQKGRKEGFKTTPTAPFITDTSKWTALGLKRVLKMAADEGYDRIGIVRGQEQAERYDLSKHLSRIRWELKPDGRYGLHGDDHNGREVLQKTLSREELPDAIGKEATDKLLEQTQERHGSVPRSGVLSGLDLKVGGEGMKGYYDKIVPETLNKLAKEYGVKVKLEGGKVKPNPTEGPDYFIESAEDGTFAIIDKADEMGMPVKEGFATKAEAQKYMRELDLDSIPIHTLDVPESMKKQIKAKGLPLYSRQNNLGSLLRNA